MKIEIEAEDFLELKEELNRTRRDLNDMRQRLKECDPDLFNQKVHTEAWSLCDKYMSTIFEKLGFETKYNRPIQWECGFWRGESDISKIEGLTVDLGANIEGEFRSAYLRLGIKIK